MKKRVYGKKLSRGQGARRALFRGLIRALVAEGAIVSTKAKIKTVQPQVEKVVNLAKKKGVYNRRRVYAILGNDRQTTDSLFNQVGPKFTDRVGGYTRAVNLPRRRGDNAEMAKLEWVKEIGLSAKDKSDESKKKKEKVEKEQKTRKIPRIKLPGRKTTKKKDE